MKRLFLICAAAMLILPVVHAQDFSDHVNVGGFGNYVRLNDGNLNLAGVGGRLSFNVLPVVQFEAESSYEFDQAFFSGFTNSPSGSASIGRTDVRMLDGLFGPKLMTNKGPVRLFVTAKGGFTNFNISNSPATFNSVGNAFSNLRGSNVYGVFYPGGGAEAFWGPIGLRVDVGDEIYFNNGGHNNLRISFWTYDSLLIRQSSGGWAFDNGSSPFSSPGGPPSLTEPANPPSIGVAQALT